MNLNARGGPLAQTFRCSGPLNGVFADIPGHRLGMFCKSHLVRAYFTCLVMLRML